MAATGIEEVLQSLMDTLGLCAEKIKGSHGIFTFNILIFSWNCYDDDQSFHAASCTSDLSKIYQFNCSFLIRTRILFLLLVFNTEGSLGQVMEDLELSFSLEEFWMKLGDLDFILQNRGCSYHHHHHHFCHQYNQLIMWLMKYTS